MLMRVGVKCSLVKSNSYEKLLIHFVYKILNRYLDITDRFVMYSDF